LRRAWVALGLFLAACGGSTIAPTGTPAPPSPALGPTTVITVTQVVTVPLPSTATVVNTPVPPTSSPLPTSTPPSVINTPILPPTATPVPREKSGTGLACPDGYAIKGNGNSGIYHVPGQQFYAATNARRCFLTEQDAINAGFRKSKV
jgi:hypothetical protein